MICCDQGNMCNNFPDVRLRQTMDGTNSELRYEFSGNEKPHPQSLQ